MIVLAVVIYSSTVFRDRGGTHYMSLKIVSLSRRAICHPRPKWERSDKTCYASVYSNFPRPLFSKNHFFSLFSKTSTFPKISDKTQFCHVHVYWDM